MREITYIRSMVFLLALAVVCGGVGPIVLYAEEFDWIDLDDWDAPVGASVDQPVVSPADDFAVEPTEPAREPQAYINNNNRNEEVVSFREGQISPDARVEAEVVEGTDRITITLDDVLLEDAVRMFAQTTGANIIATSSMMADKRVTVNLVDVDWRPALRSILEIHDLELTERSPGSGVFSVRARLADAPPPTMVQTFFLEYTTTSDVRDTIQSMLRPGASLTTFPSRNALVVRAQESNLGEIADLIAELDRPGRQVLIETRIMELDDEARKAVGIDWSVLGGYRVGLIGMERVFINDRERERVRQERGLRYDYQSDQSGMYEFYDIEGERIEGRTVPTWRATPDLMGRRPESDRSRGDFILDPMVRRDITSPDVDRYSAFDAGRGTAFESVLDRVSSHAYSDVMTAVLSPSDFSLVLSALHSTDGVSIVSNPKMLVTSGSTNAFFNVGERIPIVETELVAGTQDSPGNRFITRLATQINTDFIRDGYLETGVDLRVVATVKTEDHIEASIRPAIRRLTNPIEVRRDNRYPELAVKEIDTSFTLRSGQTVAIGGLTETIDSKETSRVPILGSIPVIGRLFRHESDAKIQTETIIFVTLSVADPDRLEDDAGIPQDARLVHTRRMREEQRRLEFEQQLHQLEAESSGASNSNSSRRNRAFRREPIEYFEAPQPVPAIEPSRSRMDSNSLVPRN